jgi:hypothetical protein
VIELHQEGSSKNVNLFKKSISSKNISKKNMDSGNINKKIHLNATTNNEITILSNYEEAKINT